MTTIKCWMKMKTGEIKRRKYKSKDGKDFTGPGGIYVGPDFSNGEILVLRSIWRIQRIAFYHQGVVTPLRINADNIEPREWGEKDMENNGGDFITSMLRRALINRKKNENMILILIIISIACLLGILISDYWIFKLVSRVGL